MEERRAYSYLCDPEKNTGCMKTSCAYNPKAKMRTCYSTGKKECARLDFDGQPVVNVDLNEAIRKRIETNFEEQGPVEIPAEYLDPEDLRIPNGGYKDPKWTNLAKEIAKDAEDKGLPWFAGLFNPKIFQEAAREEETK